MLHGILENDDCAKCKKCCLLSIDEYDKLLLFTKNEMSIALRYDDSVEFIKNNNFYSINIKHTDGEDKIKTYYECPYHNNCYGCILGSDKPLCCKIWPFVIMSENGKKGIYVSKECTVIHSKDDVMIKRFVKEKMSKHLKEFIKNNEISILDKNDYYSLIIEI